MNIIKSILAIIIGIVVGSVVNLLILLASFAVLGAPDGLNIFDPESVKAHAGGLTAANFVGTLLAHQLGTLAGALVAALIAPTRKMALAVVVGVWFMLGGIYAASLLPAPMWFVAADLLLYIPAALFGWKLSSSRPRQRHER